ncbi:hypothetical protein [Synechocystis sp. PCC 7509]|uniref:hypothetical protein n=1 Tax=Synechocystis sp. PCC 7509 TaxID=927677 RepID=UPI00048ED872|nr:hypothetical protein [Synechocystis sp. PCC 7509]
MNQSETYQNCGLQELMNYVKSIAEIETNISYQDEQKQIMPVHSKLIDVEVTTIAIKTPQLAKGEVICGEKEKVALSPSNVTNLIALIKDLQLSNGNLVKRVTYLSQEIAQFHQDLESYKDQFQKAKSRLQEKEQELAANYQTTEKLTCELAIANQLVAQVQADYNEQSYQLSAEKDNCRDLRTRLNREQQHSLQLKFALEKCLEVPTTSYQLADEMVSKANNEDSNNFAPKAPPIKPWTTQARGAGNQIDLDWERQNFPDQNNVDDDFPPMASPDYLEPFSSLNEDKLEYAIVDDVQVASPIATVNTQTNSPSPLVYPSRPPKGRKSLAAIELPSFSS